MKRMFAFLASLFCMTVIFAEVTESELSFVSYPVARIYRGADGIVAKIMTGHFGTKQLYIPDRWFNYSKETPRKAALHTLKRGTSQKPYVVIYYKGDTFSRLSLFMPFNPGDPAWCLIPNGMDFSQKFDTEEILID